MLRGGASARSNGARRKNAYARDLRRLLLLGAERRHEDTEGEDDAAPDAEEPHAHLLGSLGAPANSYTTHHKPRHHPVPLLHCIREGLQPVLSWPAGRLAHAVPADMSGMSGLSGLRASVELPHVVGFPTSEYDARYDSPTAYGGLSLSPYSSTCLARVLPQCVGSSIVPCPGFPFRASGAVDHTPSFSTAGTSGASQVLRRLSSCMPRPEDSGGPAPPCHVGWARVAFGALKPSASAQAFAKLSQHCRGRGSHRRALTRLSN